MAPEFVAAVREIASVGATIGASPGDGTQSFAVLRGRSNPRWWILPERPAAVGTASLALFQPVLPGARLLKRATALALRVGFYPPWLANRVYVKGQNNLAARFPGSARHFAYFTGTAGPHRKVVMQAMDERGNILGYAKVSQNPNLFPLMAHEFEVLQALSAVELQNVAAPHVLYHSFDETTAIVATDTTKTPHSKVPTRLGTLHLAALAEIAARLPVAAPGSDACNPLYAMGQSFENVAGALAPEWRNRLECSLVALRASEADILPSGLAHGDLTPWNSFVHGDRLYLFDWEYAGYDYPADYDLIHFLLATRYGMGLGIEHRSEWVVARLTKLGRKQASAKTRLLAYLAFRSLRYAAREWTCTNSAATWAGEQDAERMLDGLLGGRAA